MITDNIKHLETYSLSTSIRAMLEAEATYAAAPYPSDRVELANGDFFMPCAYDTQIKEISTMEAHRAYVDVMYMLEGTEMIRVKRTDTLLNITADYNPDKDCLLAEETTPNTETLVILQPGDFIILFPQDAHCPACAVGDMPASVKKIIGKVLIK